jgi:hypothetical protein
VVASLLQGKEGSLDFYEQGVCRRLAWGAARDGTVAMSCIDTETTMSPRDTIYGEMDVQRLVETLSRVQAEFDRLVLLQYPDLDARSTLSAAWLRAWSSGSSR